MIEACDSERVVLLLDGGRREEFPLEDVERVDIAAGLPHMARPLAYRELTLDPEHAQAHGFLGHPHASKGHDWKLGKKTVTPKKFTGLQIGVANS